jgi:DNA-binding response OmpR family regulator
MRILVVNDEPLVIYEIEEQVQAAGFEVTYAGSAARAHELLRCHQFDAAVLDATLDGKLSSPVAVALRERAIPILALSEYPASTPVLTLKLLLSHATAQV